MSLELDLVDILFSLSQIVIYTDSIIFCDIDAALIAPIIHDSQPIASTFINQNVCDAYSESRGWGISRRLYWIELVKIG
jgi:hypothetical protein